MKVTVYSGLRTVMYWLKSVVSGSHWSINSSYYKTLQREQFKFEVYISRKLLFEQFHCHVKQIFRNNVNSALR